ncbi:MAG: CPXCG motif-containing cysteine-rich protein [Myxococcales bacterium]
MKRRGMSETVELSCPFCGQMGTVLVDEGGGEHQTYVEDCGTCCRPRVVHVESLHDSSRGPRVWLERDDGV